MPSIATKARQALWEGTFTRRMFVWEPRVTTARCVFVVMTAMFSIPSDHPYYVPDVVYRQIEVLNLVH